jgi:hypothetical protein
MGVFSGSTIGGEGFKGEPSGHSDGAVQPIVLSLPELRNRLQAGDSLIHEILQDGVLLEGDLLLWNDLLSEAKDVERQLGMTRHSYGWSYGQSSNPNS